MNFGYGMPYYGGYGYQEQRQPMMQNNFDMSRQQTQSGDGRIWVQGEIGAKSYIIAPGNVVPLWDSESQTIWIKSVAPNGVPAMQKLVYSYDQQQQPQQAAKAQNEEYVTREEFERRIAEIIKPAKAPKVKEDEKHD